jgi:prepilin-type N-terminal cleavage/methylation domain-containing protein
MTLQQKLLAKQSKKGFTLVELVVVIAILGILAAIAIPAVVGIINNAQKSAKETNAAELSNAVKNLYAGVSSGQINADTPQDELNKLDPSGLPAKNATVEACKTAANALTVQSAVDYGGLASKFDDTNIGDYVYDNTDGTIYYKDSHEGGTALELGTTLGTIRNAASS